jgi:hypothetical protein
LQDLAAITPANLKSKVSLSRAVQQCTVTDDNGNLLKHRDSIISSLLAKSSKLSLNSYHFWWTFPSLPPPSGFQFTAMDEFPLRQKM